MSEVLRVIRLDSAIFFNAEFSEPRCLASPESHRLTPVLAAGAGHVIIYHLLCSGRACVEPHDGERVPLVAGDLAREAGLSRTVLTERFRHLLHESPMAYLTRWRLVPGARALTSTSHSVAPIASEVGDESEAAFNRAFKREYGLPPARYRREKATERQSA